MTKKDVQSIAGILKSLTVLLRTIVNPDTQDRRAIEEWDEKELGPWEKKELDKISKPVKSVSKT